MALTVRTGPEIDASEDVLAPVFVVGAVRSGTTLMSSMLSAHPAIAIAPDLHYVYGWAQKGRGLDLSSEPDFERFWNAFSRNSRFGYLGVEPAAVREHVEAHQHYSFRGVYVSALETYAANLGKRRWGEKTPLSEGHLETLFAWFPEARVVYMVRDPRAVVSSLRKTPWGSEVSVEDHAQGWAAGVKRATLWAADPRILFVRYERLVREPVREARRVCDFIGERFGSEMIDGRDALKPSALKDRQGWEKEHIAAALRPVHDGSTGKWASELMPSEIETIESICGEAMGDMERLPIGS